MAERLLSREEFEQQKETFEEAYNLLIREISDFIEYKDALTHRTKYAYDIKEKVEEIEKLYKDFNDVKQKLEEIKEDSSEEENRKIKNLINTAEKKLPKIMQNYENAKKEVEDLLEKERNEMENLNENERAKRDLEGRILVQELNDNFMVERANELVKLKNLSEECKDISDAIKFEVYGQGETLNEIEANINDTRSNVKKAEKEIRQVNQLSKKQNKRIIFISVAILILLVMVMFGIYSLFFKKNK